MQNVSGLSVAMAIWLSMSDQLNSSQFAQDDHPAQPGIERLREAIVNLGLGNTPACHLCTLYDLDEHVVTYTQLIEVIA